MAISFVYDHYKDLHNLNYDCHICGKLVPNFKGGLKKYVPIHINKCIEDCLKDLNRYDIQFPRVLSRTKGGKIVSMCKDMLRGSRRQPKVTQRRRGRRAIESSSEDEEYVFREQQKLFKKLKVADDKNMDDDIIASTATYFVTDTDYTDDEAKKDVSGQDKEDKEEKGDKEDKKKGENGEKEDKEKVENGSPEM